MATRTITATEVERGYVEFAIASGQSLSADGVNLAGCVPVGIIPPASLDGTVLTFQLSANNGTSYGNVYDEYGAEWQITIAAGKPIALDAGRYLWAKNTIKLRTGTSGSASTQSADRVFVLAVAKL